MAKAGAACHTSALAQDGTYILQCTNGHWVRGIATKQAVANVLNLLKPKSTTTTTPAPVVAAPAAVVTTTTAPAPATTTTTVPPSTTTTTVPPSTTTTTAPPPTPKTTLVSLDGTSPAGSDAIAVGVSDDGRYVVYDESDANGIMNGWSRDTKTGTVTEVTVQNNEAVYADGGTALAMSSDARYIVFVTDSNLELRDTTKNTTVAIGPAATSTTMVLNAAISADGRYVAYMSNAAGIVSGDTNASYDVFRYDTKNSTTVRASVTGSNTQLAGGVGSALAISSDGRYVVFSSLPDANTGTNHLYRRDLTSNATVEVGLNNADSSAGQLVGNSAVGDDGVAISTDGNTVAFDDTDLSADQTNTFSDVFVRNVSAGTTSVASVDSTGAAAVGSFGSFAPVMSADGRYVFFTSFATNLVANPQLVDVYVHDMTSHTTTSASIAADGVTVGNGLAEGVQISTTGRYVLFASEATNLVTLPATTGTFFEDYLNDRGA